jgi:hypothetical protein
MITKQNKYYKGICAYVWKTNAILYQLVYHSFETVRCQIKIYSIEGCEIEMPMKVNAREEVQHVNVIKLASCPPTFNLGNNHQLRDVQQFARHLGKGFATLQLCQIS